MIHIAMSVTTPTVTLPTARKVWMEPGRDKELGSHLSDQELSCKSEEQAQETPGADAVAANEESGVYKWTRRSSGYSVKKLGDKARLNT